MKATVIGDSHVEALGPRLRTMLARQGIQVERVVANRGMSTDWYNQQNRLRQAQSELAIVVLGTNDRAPDKAAYQVKLRTAAETLKGVARRIVWVGPPLILDAEVSSRVQPVREVQEDFLPHMGVTWIDSSPFTRGAHAPDGIHFTGGGYDVWAHGIADELAIQPRGFPIVPVAILGGAVLLFAATMFLRGDE